MFNWFEAQLPFANDMTSAKSPNLSKPQVPYCKRTVKTPVRLPAFQCPSIAVTYQLLTSPKWGIVNLVIYNCLTHLVYTKVGKYYPKSEAQ